MVFEDHQVGRLSLRPEEQTMDQVVQTFDLHQKGIFKSLVISGFRSKLSY